MAKRFFTIAANGTKKKDKWRSPKPPGRLLDDSLKKKSKRKKRKRFFFLNFNAFDHPPQRPFIWKGKLEGEKKNKKKGKKKTE